MNRVPDDSFADDVEAFQGQTGFGRIPRHNADLRLRIQHVDMRIVRISWNVVFQAVCRLKPQHQTAREPLSARGSRESQQKEPRHVFAERHQCVSAYMKKLTAMRKA